MYIPGLCSAVTARFQRFGQLLANVKIIRNVFSRDKCHYSVLGLKTHASLAEIKEAYYKLSKMYHPDMNYGQDDATGKIQEINEAFEVLGNLQTKQEYDAQNLPNQVPKHWKGSFIYDTEPKFYQYQYEYEEEHTPEYDFKMESNNFKAYHQQYMNHHRGVQKRKWRHYRQKLVFHRNAFNKLLAKHQGSD